MHGGRDPARVVSEGGGDVDEVHRGGVLHEGLEEGAELLGVREVSIAVLCLEGILSRGIEGVDGPGC